MLAFDIGANTGQWTLANQNNFQTIVAVEASPDSFQQLQRNCPSAISLQRAVSSIPSSTISFYCGTPCSPMNTTNREWFTDPKNRFYGMKHTETKVNTITLDLLILTYGIPDLIKVDVEGAELDTLQSLSFKVPMLCFEWASEMNQTTFDCLDYLEKLGFSKFALQMKDDYTFRPDFWVSKKDVILSLKKCVPKEDWGMIWAS